MQQNNLLLLNRKENQKLNKLLESFKKFISKNVFYYRNVQKESAYATLRQDDKNIV
jgi:hypothetical protein